MIGIRAVKGDKNHVVLRADFAVHHHKPLSILRGGISDMPGIGTEAQKTHLIEGLAFTAVNDHNVLFVFERQVGYTL